MSAASIAVGPGSWSRGVAGHPRVEVLRPAGQDGAGLVEAHQHGPRAGQDADERARHHSSMEPPPIKPPIRAERPRQRPGRRRELEQLKTKTASAANGKVALFDLLGAAT